MEPCNASDDQTVLQLLKDVEEAFQDFANNIKTEDPKVAEAELTGTLRAIYEILENGGKALEVARTALQGKAASDVQEVSSVYLNRALSIRTVLDIQEIEDSEKQEGDGENEQEEIEKRMVKQGEDSQEESKQEQEHIGKSKQEQDNKGEDNKKEYKKDKDNKGESKKEGDDKRENKQEEDNKGEIKQEDNKGERKQEYNNKEFEQEQDNKTGRKEEISIHIEKEETEEVEIKKQKKKKRGKTIEKHVKTTRYQSGNLTDMLSLFHDVEQTYSEQMRKLDKVLKDETDPIQMEIRKTMKTLLKKTKKLARESRKKGY